MTAPVADTTRARECDEVLSACTCDLPEGHDGPHQCQRCEAYHAEALVAAERRGAEGMRELAVAMVAYLNAHHATPSEMVEAIRALPGEVVPDRSAKVGQRGDTQTTREGVRREDNTD